MNGHGGHGGQNLGPHGTLPAAPAGWPPAGQQPPPTYGHPVPSGPHKSGTSVGCIVGVIVAVLVGLAAVGGALIFWTVDHNGTSDDPVASDVATAVESAPPASTFVAKPPGRVELENVKVFPDSNGQQTHVVGELFNHGPNVAASPRATVHLMSNNGLSLDKAVCTTRAQLLEPRGAVPCMATFFRAVEYSKLKIEPDAYPLNAPLEPAEIEVTGIVHKAPITDFSSHKVVGRVTNKSDFTAKGVWAIAGLYAAGGELMGSGQVAVGGGELAPHFGTKFTIHIYQVAGPITRVKVIAFGYDQ